MKKIAYFSIFLCLQLFLKLATAADNVSTQIDCPRVSFSVQADGDQDWRIISSASGDVWSIPKKVGPHGDLHCFASFRKKDVWVKAPLPATTVQYHDAVDQRTGEKKRFESTTTYGPCKVNGKGFSCKKSNKVVAVSGAESDASALPLE